MLKKIAVDNAAVTIARAKHKQGHSTRKIYKLVSMVNGSKKKNPRGNFFLGYNDILVIPAGATNIHVQEKQSSNNYLGICFGFLLLFSYVANSKMFQLWETRRVTII